MKILIIQPWIRMGGAEIVSSCLADELQKMGHVAKIATLFVESQDLPKSPAGVEYVLPPRAISDICSRNRMLFFLLGPMFLFLVVLASSPGMDLLNPHNFPSHWIAALIGRLRGLPILWTCNEPPAPLNAKDAFRVGLSDYLGWLFASSPIDLIAVKNLTHIQVLSKKAQNQVKQRYGRDSTIIRAGVDPDSHEGASAERAVHKYQLQGKYIILSVGKLHPQKNQTACLQALQKVLPFIPNAILLCVGAGPQRQELEEISADLGVANHVMFLGRVSSQELADIYAASNLNLFPAKNQSWGLTPFEALCADRVSIVSSDTGAAEVLEAEGIGLVCEPSPRAIADRILEVHASPSEFTRMAERGHGFVQKELTRTRSAEEFAKLAGNVIRVNDDHLLEAAAVSNMDIPL